MFLLWLMVAYILPSKLTSYLQWTPPKSNRSDLFCEDSCITNGILDNPCCYCKCKSFWEIQSDGTLPLFVEYDNLFGSNNLLGSLNIRNASHIPLSAVHTDGYMTAFPLNICVFPEIVEIEFSRNSISEISDLSCLRSIERVLLRGNRITYLYNTTFASNTMLREIDIAENNIKVVEPNTFVIDGITIFNVNVSNNAFKSIDITNIIFENGYCQISYDNSPIQEFTNLIDFKIDTSKSYGDSGDILMNNCSFSSFFNLTNVGITQPAIITKCFDFSIKTENLRIKCDCLLEPYLEIEEAMLKKFLPSVIHDDLQCNSPEHLKKYRLGEILTTSYLRDLLVCEHEFKCPGVCECIEQPSQRHLLINCTNANLESLPEHVPWYANYTLILDGNSIDKLDYREYLTRVTVLNISNNPLTSITDSAASVLSNSAKITALNTNLQNIPKTFQHTKPSFIILGDIFLDCTCDNIWISDWINIREPKKKSSTMFCRNRNNMDITKLNIDDLDCLEESDIKIVYIALTVLCFLLFAALFMWSCFRPEMYILYREKLSCGGKNKFETKFDVTISLDENDTFQLLWASRVLLPYLEQNYYSVYFALRDEPAAMSIEDCVQYQVIHSRAYIFLVSKNSYPSKASLFSNDIDLNDWTIYPQNFHFTRMWKLYKRDKFRKLIVINFDNTEISKIRNRNLKAFLRVREAINFTDRHGNILHKIKAKLGEPGNVCGLNNINFVDKVDMNGRKLFKGIQFYQGTEVA